MLTKDTADYHYNASEKFCIDCKMFKEPHYCSLVAGYIHKLGHCSYFEANKSLPTED